MPTPERLLLFDVNDFDETLPGPFEYDVKRMAASFTIAARSNGFAKAGCHRPRGAGRRRVPAGGAYVIDVAQVDIQPMRDQVFFEGPERSRRLSRYWLLLVLSAVIASAGVVSDSTATVIGAMIVAPLMTRFWGSCWRLCWPM